MAKGVAQFGHAVGSRGSADAVETPPEGRVAVAAGGEVGRPAADPRLVGGQHAPAAHRPEWIGGQRRIWVSILDLPISIEGWDRRSAVLRREWGSEGVYRQET